MSFLFWLLSGINLLLIILVIAGKGFRSGFGAGTDFNSIMLIVLVIVIIASLVVRFAFKLKWLSVIIAALPVFALFVMYLLEKKTKFQ